MVLREVEVYRLLRAVLRVGVQDGGGGLLLPGRVVGDLGREEVRLLVQAPKTARGRL